MIHRDGDDLVSVPPHRTGGLQLDHAQLERQASVDHHAHRLHQLAQAAWAVHRQRLLPVAQGKRLQHPGQPQPMVGVEVGDEHAVEVPEHAQPHELALGAFATVEQQAIAPAADEDRG